MGHYSRKIVGWEVYATPSADQAADVFRKAHLREGVGADTLFLHPDKSATLQRLGVVPSFSSPAASNDNP